MSVWEVFNIANHILIGVLALATTDDVIGEG
jgi:hypothetical protein